jgi:penicillin-binding protein 1A
VGVYSVFPNQGVAVEPYLIDRIEDAYGEVIYRHDSQPQTALKPSTAFLVAQALIGVIQRGTGQSASSIIGKYGVPLGGKTGTTDDYTDAWFVGFSPQIVCGVWVGNKEKVTIGDDESGAVAALPIWRRFMDAALEHTQWRRIRTYEMPANVVAARVDHRNGLLASEFTPPGEIIVEFFIKGTEPTRETTYDDDYNLRIRPIRLMEKRVTIDFENDDRVMPREFYETNW